MGDLKQASNPHIGAIFGDRGETFEAESEVADLRQSKCNENHIDNPCLPQPHVPQGGTRVP